VEDIDSINSLPQVKPTKRQHFIYCFPYNITIGKRNYLCPPSVFRLPLDETFSILDTTYEAQFVELNVTDDVKNIDQFTYEQFAIVKDTSATRDWIIEAAKSKSNLESIKRENLIMPKLATQLSLSATIVIAIVLVLTFRYRMEVIRFLKLKSQSKQPIITAPIEEIEMQPKANVSQTFNSQGRPMYPIMTG